MAKVTSSCNRLSCVELNHKHHLEESRLCGRLSSTLALWVSPSAPSRLAGSQWTPSLSFHSTSHPGSCKPWMHCELPIFKRIYLVHDSHKLFDAGWNVSAPHCLFQLQGETLRTQESASDPDFFPRCWSPLHVLRILPFSLKSCTDSFS